MDDEIVVTFRRLDANQGLCVLEIRGDLDITVSRSLTFELHELLDVGTPRVGVDLSGVPFMDSSALSALVRARQRAIGCGQSFDLMRPSPACARVLESDRSRPCFRRCLRTPVERHHRGVFPDSERLSNLADQPESLIYWRYVRGELVAGPAGRAGISPARSGPSRGVGD